MNVLDVYFLCIITILGLCIGSFLNVVVLRGFSGESIILPPSKCPICKNKLKWYHNIPLFSFIFLRGKCGFCNAKISIQYPIVELFTALCFISIYLKFGLTINSLFLCGFCVFFILFTVTDLKEQVIFVEHTYLLAILGLIYNFFNINTNTVGLTAFFDSLIGVVVGFLLIESISSIIKLFIKQRAFGEGDSYVLAGLGAILGYQMIFVIFAAAVLLQGILALPIFLHKLFKQKNYLLIFYFILFFVSATIFHFTETLLAFWGIFAFMLYLLILAGILVIELIKRTKKEEKLTTLPFGPALSVVAFLFIFFNINFAIVKEFCAKLLTF